MDRMTVDQHSPLIPAMELPLWLRQRAQRARNTAFSGGRARLILIASACILLGYFLTTAMGSNTELYYDQDEIDNSDQSAIDASDAILEGPAGSIAEPPPLPRPQRGKGRGRGKHHGPGDNTPSIKGALSDLGNAVGGRISGIASSLRLPGSSAARNISRPGIFSSYQEYNTSPSLPVAGKDQAGRVSEQLLSPNRDMLGARQRVGKVTIIFGSSPIYERAVRTHEAHDAVHGYPLHVLRHGIMDDVWSKPAYILSLLLRELGRPEGERLQWLLWVDADTILLNPHVPVEVFLPPSPEFDDVNMLVTRDWNGLNNGVFPVRVNQWAVDLFAAIVSYRYYRPEAPLVFRDQSAMDALLKEPRFAKHTTWAPQRWFNAYQGEHNETLAPFQVRRGDFLVHFAGVGDRTERMTYWLDRVEQHLPDWEIGVQHTSYPSEARDFWAQERQTRADVKHAIVQAINNGLDLVRMTEEQLNEYQSRIGQGDVNNIREKIQRLKDAATAEEVSVERISKVETELGLARGALDKVALDARKALMKEAHEAIFGAEKILLQASDRGKSDVRDFEDAAGRLKALVLSPSPTASELLGAIDTVRSLRTRLEQEKQREQEELKKQKQQQQHEEEDVILRPAGGASVAGESPRPHAAEEAPVWESDLRPAGDTAIAGEVAAADESGEEPLIFITETRMAYASHTETFMVMQTIYVDAK